MVVVAGRINFDIIISVDGYIERGKKFVGRIVAEGVGGTGANIAISIARAGIKDVSLIGVVGKDLAERIINALKREGVDTKYVFIANEYTGRAYIFVDPSGEATIVSVVDPNTLLKDLNIPDDVLETENAYVIANTSRDVALKILRKCNKENKVVFFDPGPAWNPFELIAEAGEAKYECFVIPNEYEFMAYQRKLISFDNIPKSCVVIVKKGVRGSETYDLRNRKVLRVSSLPLKKLGLEVKSTAGCGDVFTGVFAATYLEKRNLEEALIYATVAAGVKATRILSYDSPKRDELIHLVEKYRSLLEVDEKPI